MYTIYICDDDALFASSLCAKVQQLFPGSFQISVFHSIRALQAAAEKTPPNIALLDIQLGQDNGISLAKQLFPSPSQTQVIFITGYVEYCSDVYETEHIYFLLKPLDPVLLKKSLQQAVDRLEALPITLSIQTREGAFSLPLTDILYIESHMRKLSIHTPKTRMSSPAPSLRYPRRSSKRWSSVTKVFWSIPGMSKRSLHRQTASINFSSFPPARAFPSVNPNGVPLGAFS